MLEQQRQVYVSSGRFVVSDVLVGASFLGGIALLIASILAWLTANNAIDVWLVWLCTGLILYWRVRRTVGKTKTRNRLVGFVLGFLTGTITLVGLYHIDQCSRWGVEWHRLDRLPGYVTFRNETDVWVHQGKTFSVNPAPAQAGGVPWRQPRVTLSRQWVAFFGQIGLIVLITGFIGLHRARRPFSEVFNDWFNRETMVLTPNSAKDLRAALESGALSEWITTGVEKTGIQESHVIVTFWYCSRTKKTDEIESSVYVSFRDGPCFQLVPEETAVLSQIVPGLAEFAIPTEEIYDDPKAPPSEPNVARLFKVPGPHAGNAKKPSVIWMGRIKMYGMFYLLPFLLFLLVILFAMFGDRLGVPQWAIITTVAVAGLSFVAFLGWWINDVGDNPTFRMLRRHYRNVVVSEMVLRSDVLFSPSDPRLIYVNLIPRQNWSELSERRIGNDSAFLIIDVEQQQILYEGDRFRFIIPAVSIVRCEVEEITQTQTTAGFYAAVLIARTKNCMHSFPLVPLEGIEGENRFEKAVALQNRILWELETEIPQGDKDAVQMNGFSPRAPQAPIII